MHLIEEERSDLDRKGRKKLKCKNITNVSLIDIEMISFAYSM